jgi:NB-ARC domain
MSPLDAQEALKLVDEWVFSKTGEHLDDLHCTIFQQAWQGKTYKQIAKIIDYSEEHIKAKAAKLWEMLSDPLPEKDSKTNSKKKKEVNKANFKSVLQRKWESQQSEKAIKAKENKPYCSKPEIENPDFCIYSQAIITHQYQNTTVESQASNQQSLRGVHIPNTRNQVFGRNELIKTVLNTLTDAQSMTIHSLSGKAGYGKTEVATGVASEALKQNLFADVLWVKARQTELVEGVITPEARKRVLDWEQLHDEIAHQLKCSSERVQQRLREEKFLVVIDNAETADMAGILSQLFPMLNPSRAFLTSRIDYEPRLVKGISIPGLEIQHSTELLKYEAHLHSIPELLQANDEQFNRIHKLSCGAPLALHFVVSRIRQDKDIQPVLWELERADKEVEVFYRFALETAWQRITEVSKKILKYIGGADAGVSQDELLGAGGFGESDLNAGKRELRRWHLLEDLPDAKGTQRYDLHSWVRNSVRAKLVDTWQPSVQDLKQKFRWKFDKGK